VTQISLMQPSLLVCLAGTSRKQSWALRTCCCAT